MRLRVLVYTCVFLSQMFAGFLAAPAVLAATAGLELSELLVDPAAPLTDDHDEYIEFHNAGVSAVILSDYKLKFGTSATLYSLPSLSVPADGYIAVVSSDPTAKWALTNSGSTINLLSASGEVLESTTWKTAVTGAGWAKGADGSWSWTTTPTSGTANQFTAPASTPGQGSITAAPLPAGATSYPEVELNELFPDPAAPLTDAADEFVEVYNPNAFPVDLAGYVVKTGASLTTKHTISGTVAPGAYLALKSAATKIALANDGSSVALFDPTGIQLGATITYPKATTGAAWARSDAGWSWTSTPTPGGANVLTAPAPTAAATKAAASKAAKASSTATKAATAAAKAAAKTKAAATKAAKTTAPLMAAASTSGGHWLLFGLAGLTIAYVIYEFRYDLRNFYFKLRGYPVGGGALGKVAQGRRSRRVSE